VVNILASTIATAVAIDVWGARGAGIAAAAMTVILITFGEVLPKSVAAYRADAAASIVVGPIALLTKLLSPVTFLLTATSNAAIRLLGGSGAGRPGVTPEEIRSRGRLGQEQGVLDEREHDVIVGVCEFGEKTVGEIVVPEVDI